MKVSHRRHRPGVRRLKSVSQPPRGPNVQALERHLASCQQQLLVHRYFRHCRAGNIERGQLIEIVKQLYCFSVFFERLLTMRIARHSSQMDERILAAAREHLREEIGHAELFQVCLLENGVSAEEIDLLAPSLFTKALFGYLVATVMHENEYVANVAIMQVMEGIGLTFFQATLELMDRHQLSSGVMQQHTEDDLEHWKIGLELADEFDAQTMENCHRVVDDLYRLMGHVLDEWLALFQQDLEPAAETG
jgi:thiaminase